MTEVDLLLRQCGCGKHYARLSQANIVTLDVMQEKRALLPALITNPEDLQRVLAALGTYRSEYDGFISPEDDLKAELLKWQEKLRTRMRDLAKRHADQLVSRVAPFKRGVLRGGPSRNEIASTQVKSDRCKALLTACNAAIRTHQKYMELGRMLRRSRNKGGNPFTVDASQEQLAEYEKFVKEVLVRLQEEGKRGFDFSQTMAAPEPEEPEEEQEEPGPSPEEIRLTEALDKAEASMAEVVKAKEETEEDTRRIITEAQLDALRSADRAEALLAQLRNRDETIADLEAERTELSAGLSQAIERVHHLERSNMELLAEVAIVREAVDPIAAVGESSLQAHAQRDAMNNAVEIESLQARIAALEETVATRETRIAEVETTNEGLVAELNTERASCAELRGVKADLDEKLTAKTTAFEALQKNLVAEITQHRTSQDKCMQLTAQLGASKASGEKLTEQVVSLKAELNKPKAATDSQTSTIDELLRRVVRPARLLPAFDAKLPEEIGFTALELRDCLVAHGVPDDLANRHVGALSRKLQDCAATVARELTEDRAIREAAATTESVLHAQLELIMKLPRDPSDAAGGVDEDGKLAAGTPVVSHLLLDSWGMVEAAVGFAMPLTRPAMRERGGEVLSLEDELFATQDDMLRILRMLRSMLYVADQDEEEEVPEERDAPPVQIMGQRRE